MLQRRPDHADTPWYSRRELAMGLMTIGALSRRTGLRVKTLREYEDLGLIYTVGRSPGNYRLFNDEALWCVGIVSTLRALGLTLTEIVDLVELYLKRREKPLGPRLAEALRAVRNRTEQRIEEQNQLLKRLDEFEAAYAAELAGRKDFRLQDPRFEAAS